MLKTKHKTPNKHYDCIHRGKKPYPVCPKCDGYWGGYLNPKRPMCMLCDYKPSQEELSILTQTKDMYAKQKKGISEDLDLWIDCLNSGSDEEKDVFSRKAINLLELNSKCPIILSYNWDEIGSHSP